MRKCKYLKQHISELMDEHDIVCAKWLKSSTNGFIAWCNLQNHPGYSEQIWMPMRSIVCPNPRLSRKNYYICLHEIGHIVTEQTYDYWAAETLMAELEAWDWALENAIVPPNRHVREAIKDSTLVYERDKYNYKIKTKLEYQYYKQEVFQKLNAYPITQSYPLLTA